MVGRREVLCVTLLHFVLVWANQGEPAIHDVIGLLHQMVEMSNYLELPSPVMEVDWFFTANGNPEKVARFDYIEPKFYFPQFEDRLKLSHNGTTLQVKDVTLEDSGDYRATIIQVNKKTINAHFRLVVYDPVPSPSIQVEYEKASSEQCNVTLQCSVPTNASSLSYSWRYIQRGHELFYNNSDRVQTALLPEFPETEFMCIVNNPADSKNISQPVRCEATGLRAHRGYFYTIFLLLVIIPMIVLSVIIWKRRRKDKDNMTGVRQLAADEEEDLPQVIASSFYPENHPSSSSRTFSWDKREEQSHVPQQKFETLYISLHQDN